MSISIHALKDVPLIKPNTNLANMINSLLSSQFQNLKDGDTLVLAQKIVSKAEGRYVSLNNIQPTAYAVELSQAIGKDPRYIQVVLNESKEVVCYKKNILIVEHKLGFIHANAGIDESNIEQNVNDPQVLLLPEDPDRSAYLLQCELLKLMGKKFNIIISDSTGRAFRKGICGIAIGSAGFKVLQDLYGALDLYGNVLVRTEVATADELASAASLLMGQGDEANPVILLQGVCLDPSALGAKELIRPKNEDLFRS